MNPKNVKGQGAIQNPHNHFEKLSYVQTFYEDSDWEKEDVDEGFPVDRKSVV